MSIKQKTKSLKAKGNNLSDGFFQLSVLNDKSRVLDEFLPFSAKIKESGYTHIKPTSIEIFQINIGKLCNQTCAHCHVDAGPDRKEEQMSKATLEKCLALIKSIPTVHTVDITGGAPEMNVNFKWFVEELSKIGKQVINRCNLTIIVANKKYHDLPQFFKDNNVHVVSSLPYFSQSRTDSQRGDGVFEDSIKALKMLNEVGYGIDESLKLDLVYNPSGAFLPGSQESLQSEFKRQLKRKYAIDFNGLLCITNLPVSRFLDYLIDSGNYQEYMQKLLDAYNPNTIEGLMCRNTISVSWDGYLYDCDFNQMLDLKVASESQHIDDFDLDALNERIIVINQHCYGCTAGAGSSCGGEIA
jgi:radical SAM/Cys-rich protein